MKKILFLSLCSYESICVKDIYTDMLREFARRGYRVVIASPLEKKYKKRPRVIKESNCEIVQVLIDDYFSVNPVKKGVSLLTIDRKFKKRLSSLYKDTYFDMIIYATPPIMFLRTIMFFKRKGTRSLLLLKDIFPQNAVDLGMMKINGLLYKYFRRREKRLYALSDRIGCMSEANVAYLLNHNPDVERAKVAVVPNCIEPFDLSMAEEDKKAIRMKYGIPLKKTVFVYGGNLGAPQGVPFIVKCLEAERNNDEAFFLIVGDGTEYDFLEKYYQRTKQSNFLLLKKLPTDEFNKLLCACDVGLLFLDYRFTIPNFPSRLLSYMQAKLPVLASVDEATDVGHVIEEGGFGWCCPSSGVSSFCEGVKLALGSDLQGMGAKSNRFLIDHYSVENVCRTIEELYEATNY